MMKHLNLRRMIVLALCVAALSVVLPQSSALAQTKGERMAQIAQTYVGKTGSQLGYNYAWCAAIACKWAEEAGLSVSKTASAPLLAKLNGFVLTRRNGKNKIESWTGGSIWNYDFPKPNYSFTPKVGDLVFFETMGTVADGIDHVGVVVGVSGNNVTAVEGNYGGRVAKNTYNWKQPNSKVWGFARLGGSSTQVQTKKPAASSKPSTPAKKPTSASRITLASLLNSKDCRGYLRFSENMKAYKDTKLKEFDNSYIYPSDFCRIVRCSSTNAAILVEYPTARGKKQRWVHPMAFFYSLPSHTVTATRATCYIDVTARVGGSKIGTIYPNDTVYVLKEWGSYCQVLYPAGSYWKFGFVPKSKL